MPVHRIDHVTLNSSDLARTSAFYADVLGFQVRPMEGYGHVGAWLYLDDHPFVHVMACAPDTSDEGPARMDHFALEATDVAATRARLESKGVTFRENTVPELDFHQIVFHDPDGVKIELNFRGLAA
jgi:catechol 2,3-dioxygenase-like lactoylglutathione lyase family enzyme